MNNVTSFCPNFPMTHSVFELPIQEFYQTVKEASKVTEELSETLLSDSCQAFREERFVRPIECKQILASLQSFREQVQSLCQLFENPFYLPENMLLHRYDFLLTLCEVNEKIPQVSGLISEFYPICLDSSRHTIRQQKIIKGQLDEVFQCSKRIVLQLQGMKFCVKRQMT